jgi:hypothetical protein
MSNTPFSKRCDILAQTYDHPDFGDFVAQYNIGVPAAYMIANNLMSGYSVECHGYIDEAWLALLVFTESDPSEDYFELQDLTGEG